jgi:predicted Zn finger-like uncharacterized protein
MKISCQSCQSKYNVADEKVQGKIVKIRCRKCGATIVVNGTAGAASNGSVGSVVPEMPAHAGAPADGGEQWHVNVSENDQRSMSMAELVEAYNAGAVTQETFIWTDGMDDWKPLSEVDAVVSALHAHADQAAAASGGGGDAPVYAGSVVPAYEPEPAPAARTYEAPAYEAPAPPPSYGSSSSYGAQGGAVAAAAEPRRAAVVKREARARDLFGTAGSDEVQTSAPSMPHAASQEADDAASKLTGERNENSVLFSLAVLTQGGEERAHEAPSPTQKDDSGLIDLRALAARSESLRPAAPKADGDVFAPPLGFTAPPLGAPLGALGSMGGDAQAKSKLPLFIGIGAGALLLVVASVVVGVKVGASNAPVPSATVIAMPTAPTAEPPPSATAEASATASAAPSASASSGKPKAVAGGGGTYHPPAAGGGKPAAPAAAGGAAAPAPAAAAAPAKKNDCGCNGDLMCLMKCSTH